MSSAYQGGLTTENLVDRFDQWWTLSLTNAYYGSNSIRTTAVSDVIISTGQSMIYLAKTDYLNFEDEITNAGPNAAASIVCRNLLFNYCFSSQPCSNFSSELSPLTFKLSNTNYVIPPAGYLLSNTLGHSCVIGVSYVSDS